MEIMRTAKRHLRDFGGIKFLDDINYGLLTLGMLCDDKGDDYFLPDSIGVGGEEWFFLGAGADRIVYHNGVFVLKFTSNGTYSNREANRKEFEVYKRVVGTPVAKFFAPSIALMDEYRFGDVLFAKKVPGETPFFDQVMALEAKVDSALLSLGVQVSANDMHTGNVRSGKIIDYGRFYIDGKYSNYGASPSW